MKIVTALFFSIALGVFLAPAAQAQSFQFSSFQCDPLSCQEQTPLPVFIGTVSVTFQGDCTGGVVAGIESFATTFIGTIGPCPEPFTPKARIGVTTSQFFDDVACTVYSVDTVTAFSDITDAFGIPVFHDESSASCDGGTTGPIHIGQKPC